VFELQKWKTLASKLGARAEKAESDVKTTGELFDAALGDYNREKELREKAEAEVERLRWYERDHKHLTHALRSWAESGKTMPANEFAAWLLRDGNHVPPKEA